MKSWVSTRRHVEEAMRDAEEAMRKIRERLGDDAEVLAERWARGRRMALALKIARRVDYPVAIHQAVFMWAAAIEHAEGCGLTLAQVDELVEATSYRLRPLGLIEHANAYRAARKILNAYNSLAWWQRALVRLAAKVKR